MSEIGTVRGASGRIYLAARYSRREELCVYADELRAAGLIVTSRWLLGEHQWDGDAAEVARAYEERGELWPATVRFAVDDWEDLTSAGTLVSFTEPTRSVSSSRGGRHVEHGIALGRGMRVLVVGHLENVFHLLPGTEFHPTWESARAALLVGVSAGVAR
jgi:hypothetical protein